MASSHHDVEEILKCSICLDFFKDPMVLSCSHSFCSSCLEQSWSGREVKQCHLCRKKIKHTPCKSQIINDISEQFVSKKRRILKEGDGCQVHDEEFKLFCTEDQTLLCYKCVSMEHNNHNFCSIDKAAKDHIKQLQQPLQLLQTKLTGMMSATLSPHLVTNLKNKTLEIENKIKDHFKELHLFLNKEEALRIDALRVEEQKTEDLIVGKMQKLTSSLSNQIRKIKEDMGGNQTLFLKNFTDIKKRVDMPVPELQIIPISDLKKTKHLFHLRFNVWEKMQDICPKDPEVQDQISLPLLKFTINTPFRRPKSPDPPRLVVSSSSSQSFSSLSTTCSQPAPSPTPSTSSVPSSYYSGDSPRSQQWNFDLESS